MTHHTRKSDKHYSLDDDGGWTMTNFESGLWLIGLGPGDLSAMTTASIEAAKSCNYRFLEGYTALLPSGEGAKLVEIVGEYELLMRPGVENPDQLLELASENAVALMIVGDPLQATTHVDLQLRAKAAGINCHVIHGISITTIVTGAVGLQSYRFGRQVTLAYPYGDYLATSPFELILDNLQRDLHSLVLLDLDPTGMGVDEQNPMSPAMAVDILRRSADKIGENIEQWKIVLCSDMGRPEQRIFYGTLDDVQLINNGSIHCIVIPGRLDELEVEALARWN
nr:diphthine synthase [Euryarchaeota archaeon]